MIDDERGRVPFAIVAILLLVSSATVATTLAPAAPPDEPAVDVVTDRVEAEQRTVLRRAVRDGARGAANDPVVERANTTVGHALDDGNPFRDSLRLRVYVAAREQFEAMERRRGGVVAMTTLPPVDASDTASVREAIERVDLSAADGNGTAVTVRIGNVTTTVRRGDRILDESRASPEVTVATPVLALHDRVAEYEERLNAGLTSPGLEQRLAAVLNGVGWARGYAQYSGAPIDNVVSNGHVEVATNAAILDVQRATIGEVDPAGVRGLKGAVGKLGLQKFLALSPGSSPYLEQALDRQSVVPANDIEGVDVPARDEPMTVGVNRTAEDVFLTMMAGHGLQGDLVDVRERLSLGAVVGRTYEADARVSGRFLSQSGGPPDVSSPPGRGWEQLDTTLDRTASVSDAGTDGSAGSADGWHPFETYTRRVVTHYDRTTTWTKGIERERTHSRDRETATVQVTVEGNHAPRAPGPDRRIDGVHDRGVGPLDGPNLAGIESNATDRLLDDRGGKDAVARRLAHGRADTEPITVTGERPDGLREYVYRDLRALRENVSEVSVEVDRRDVGSFAANPPSLLAEKVRERRAELLDAPASYDGVAVRARVAARAKYLTLVTEALDRRASDRTTRRDGLGDALEDVDAGSVEDVQRSARAAVAEPGARKPALDGPGGPVDLRVDAAPAYLTRSSVEPSRVPAVENETRPLATRNVNVFSLPYGEVIDGVLGAILEGPERTTLGTAARTLRSSEDLGVDDTTSFEGVPFTLESSVDGGIDAVENDVVALLAERDVGTDESEREAIVRDGLERWNGTAATAIALSNGTAADGILEAADERVSLGDVERDRLGLELDRGIRETLSADRSQPQSAFVDDVSQAVKSEAKGAIRDVAEKYANAAVKRVSNGTVSTLPSGLPLAPVPGYWYATTNVWHVEVEGEYARFGVRASRGRPVSPGADLAYARDGGSVTFDVDGDGTAERLGTSRRVQFSATVDVVVVVPPGAQGVGDVSGERDERSEGWPLHEE